MQTKRIKALLIATIFAIESIAVGYAPVSAQTVSENTEGEKVETEIGSQFSTANNAAEVVAEPTEVSADKAEIVYSGKDGDLDWSIDSEGHLTITGTGDYAPRDYSSENGWLAYKEEIKSAYVDVSGITSTQYMFHGCSSLTSLDISALETSQVTDMEYMFSDCRGLTSLDVSDLETSQVTDMNNMFRGCSGLESLDVSDWDTSQVIDMEDLFYDCSSLTSLDISHFDTSQVWSMWWMFGKCSSLTSLDVSNFDTSQVACMFGMFNGCSGLISLDVSNFDMSQATVSQFMFSNCSSLIEIKSPKNVNADIELPAPSDCIWKDSDGNTCTTLTKGVPNSILYKRYTELAGATVDSIANQPCTGKAVTPIPQVTYGDTVLQNGTDYTLSYTNNINPGTATVIITGTGRYTGTKTISFTINSPINLAEVTVSTVSSQPYTGQAITPQPQITYKGTVLQNGTDYTLSYTNNINPGTATVTITGKGKYTGSKTTHFAITVVLDKATIDSFDFSYKKGNLAKLNTKTYYSLYLDFVPVDFAKKYEIELTNNKGKKVKTVTVDCENKDYVENTIKNLTAAVYGVRIRAIRDGVYGEWSDKSYVIKQPRAQARTYNGNVQIKWEKISGATGYDIYMSTKRNSGYKKVASVGKNTTIQTIKKYNKNKLMTKTYYYYVVAKKKVGSKTYKSVKSYVYKVKNKK